MLTIAFTLTEWARDALAWLEGAVSSVSPAGWVLLIVAGAALGWVVSNIRALTRLGPIEVQTLEHDGADGAVATKALTAAFREALARTGLIPPPAVPSGTPQVNLLAAVEASNISQAAWVAKLIAMIPRPRPHEYTITGTLKGEEPQPDPAPEPSEQPLVIIAGPGAELQLGAEPDPDEDPQPEPAPSTNCGVSVWVRPSREGRELIETYDSKPTHLAALEHAATEIYLHISNHAVEAFPIWARWHEREALAAYRRGCQHRSEQDLDLAILEFTLAAERERFNKLADLELATMYEQQAELQDDEMQIAVVQAKALRQYLEILLDANTLIQAHYRVSIVAGALATRCKADPDGALRQQVLDVLALEHVHTDNLASTLQRLAERENRVVLQMLSPFYALLNEWRLRTQFEPHAHQRRQLKHTAGISKHCVWARTMVNDLDEGRRRRWSFWWRSKSVHWLHLKLGWGSLSWQAHYNAASFDALVLQRKRNIVKHRQANGPA